jgi:hypothetical protein
MNGLLMELRHEVTVLMIDKRPSALLSKNKFSFQFKRKCFMTHVGLVILRLVHTQQLR